MQERWVELGSAHHSDQEPYEVIRQSMDYALCATLLLSSLVAAGCTETSTSANNQELTFVPNCGPEPQSGPNVVSSVRYRGTRTQAGTTETFEQVHALGEPLALSGGIAINLPLAIDLLNSNGVVLHTRTVTDGELSRGASSYAAPLASAMGPNPDRTFDFVSSAGNHFEDVWKFSAEPAPGSYVLSSRKAQLIDAGDPIACNRVVTVNLPTDAGIDAGMDAGVDAGSDAGLDCDGGCTTGAAPTITSITPNSGVPGTIVTISGTDFRSGATVSIGGIAATSVTVVSGTSITATVPNGLALGSHDVVVTNTDTTSVTSSNAYVVPAPPTITGIAPNNGLPGSSVTISGTNFRAGATVSIGGIAATVVGIASGMSITATVPSGLTQGAQNVVVTNIDTTSVTAVGGYTVNAGGGGAPTVATLTPDGTLGGPWLSGLPFTITGTNFQAGVTVTLGGVDCSVNTVTATQIEGFVPSGVASGDQTLVITNPDNSTVSYGPVFCP